MWDGCRLIEMPKNIGHCEPKNIGHWKSFLNTAKEIRVQREISNID
jgi:hypothetical protein